MVRKNDIEFSCTTVSSMTPMKVRGKRGQHQPIREGYRRSQNSLRSAIVPFTQLSDSFVQSVPAYSSKMKLPVPSDNHNAANVAPIERLPVELLEIIFFSCLNVSLPQASPIIGNALSSFHCKARVAELAFSSITRNGLTYAHHLKQWRPDMASFQSSLLKLRWMTVDFWRRYVPIYLEKTILSVFQHHNLEWMDGTPAKCITRAMVAQYVQAAYKQDHEGSGRGTEDVIKWNVSLPQDICIELKIHLIDGANDARTTRLTVMNRNGLVGPRINREGWTMVHCLRCQIPAKLLHGPWTESKCQFLQMLVSTGANIEWYTTTAGEVAERGLVDAIKERNRSALCSLFGFGSPRLSLYGMCDRRRGKWVVPGPSHLAFAIMYEDCEKDIVELLFHGRGGRYAVEDDTLVEWAVQKKREGDDRGSWLLGKLDEYPAMSLPLGEKWVYVPPSPESTTTPVGRFVLVSWSKCQEEK